MTRKMTVVPPYRGRTADELLAGLEERINGIASALETARDDLASLAELSSSPAPVAAVAPRLLTIGQAARALAVGATTVKALIASGELESRKIGASRRIPVEALDVYAGKGL
jgi:excisionase family DNA binding protein